jgi:PAS domain S-box-containing protein
LVLAGIIWSQAVLLNHLHAEGRQVESESHARLTGIFSSAMDAIITIDSQQRIMMINRAGEKMFQHDSSTVLGQPLEMLIPHRFRDAHQQHVAQFGETGVTTRQMGKLGDLSGLRADGTEFPIEASISQTEIGGQKIFTVILRDITLRKESEATASLMAAIVTASEDAIISSTKEGIVTSWNPGAERLYGYSAEEAIGEQM